MRSKLFLFVFVACYFLPNRIIAQDHIDKRLQRDIETLVRGFHGDVSVYAKNLRTGKIISIHADTVFPTASMIKIPIMIGIMQKIQSGELQYHQVLQYKDSLLYAGEDILGSFKNDEKIELSKVMMLMLTMSDNTASLWLQSLAGGGARINQILDSLGFTHTRVNSRTAGREAARNNYGWGETTSKEMCGLMEKIHTGKIFNDTISQKMQRLLGRDYWDEESISQIPTDIFVAAKSGAVDASRSETLLVMAPHNPYVFSIVTKNNIDTSWKPNNEAWILTRKISRHLWHYFAPKYQYTGLDVNGGE